MLEESVLEINVAVIGHVSAGKTTLLNALFRDKYGEVSMKRTTAGVHKFRVLPQTEDGEALPTAEETHAIIKDHNVMLRLSNSLEEKEFSVQVKEPLVEMHKDTQLVLVDIPGINEAGSSSKYRDYVRSNWKNFDASILVMDAKQGVNSEDSIELLKFVKGLQRINDIPVIILFNKVDDPDDKEEAIMLQEARMEIENLFRVTNREQSLTRILNGEALADEKENIRREAKDKATKEKIIGDRSCSGTLKEATNRKAPKPTVSTTSMATASTMATVSTMSLDGLSQHSGIQSAQKACETHTKAFFGAFGPLDSVGNDGSFHQAPITDSVYPVFIPISARNAYLYQTTSMMHFERFRTFDEDLIQKLGLEQIGRRRWNKLTPEQRLFETFEVLCDEIECAEGLKRCNFDKLMCVLQFSIGGKETQRKILDRRIESLKQDLRAPDLGSQVHRLGTNVIMLRGKNLEEITKAKWVFDLFWEKYSDHEVAIFEAIDSLWKWKDIVRPMNELLEYHRCFGFDPDHQETKRVSKALKRLVQIHASGLFESEDSNEVHWWNWSQIYGSLLLLSNEKCFVRELGPLKILLESNYQKCLTRCHQPFNLSSCFCQNLKQHPNNPYFLHCSNCQITVSRSPTNMTRCINRNCSSTLDGNNVCVECGVLYAIEGSPSTLDDMMKTRFDGMKWVPKYPFLSKHIQRVHIPESLADESHFGHIAWKFCCFVNSVQTDSR